MNEVLEQFKEAALIGVGATVFGAIANIAFEFAMHPERFLNSKTAMRPVSSAQVNNKKESPSPML